MDILITTKRAPFEGRGAEQVIWRIGKRFADAGHRVRFFCPTPVSERTIECPDGIDFSFVSTSNSPTQSMIEFFVYGPLKYKREYNTFKPDIVYDNPSPFPFHMAHLYGSTPVMTKVHAIYRSLAFPCKDNILVQIGTVAGEESYRLFRDETFITNSESTAERLEPLVDTDANEVLVNPIGINVDEFDFDIPHGSKEVVTISKLSSRKRVSDLLQAWERVEREHPDASLKIAGSGPLEDKLRGLAEELQLSQVDFLGYVNDTKKHELLRNGSIYVSPTLYEGFGLSLLEAMASGCAVISSNTWGIKDYLSDGNNGRLVEPESPPKFADALIELLNNKNKRHRFAQEGRKTAETFAMEDSLDRELAYLENRHN